MNQIKLKKLIGFLIITILICLTLAYFNLGGDKPLIKDKSSELNKDLSKQLPLPNGFGVSFHFNGTSPDTVLMKNAGINIARTDLFWSEIEKKRGFYDYSGYDQLTEDLIESGIKPYYILNYSNKLYEKNFSIVTEKGQNAFVDYVDDVTSRYSGYGIVWEIWNEPNLIEYWDTRPNYEDYSKLVKNVSKVIRKNDPTGIVVAPALAGLNNDSLIWLEEILKRGLLENIDALSVHPYRTSSPETVIEDYQKLRDLLNKYNKKNFPIISGEWGYSTAREWNNLNISEKQQAQYLIRMFLVNEWSNIPITIWYDWKNDGIDSKEREHNFGIRQNDVSKSKESYIALKVMTKTLSNYSLSKRIDVGNPSDFVFEFKNKLGDILIVYWTIEGDHLIKLPEPENGSIISMYGDNLGRYNLENDTILEITASPRYLIYK
ncbi:cellulase family glycosylhydrolase [Peribacillus sp. NPDC097895]|uniref:cellulase family glycosylhydrolase n=1 Tax=Peribacillus sp. NPDC097895 TaxID=3390619 RepID=UPI003CFBF2B7